MIKAMRAVLITGVIMMITGCGFKENLVENSTESMVQTEDLTTEREEATESIVLEESKAEQVKKEETKKDGAAIADDNFSVDMEDIVEFADKVKEAVIQKDLEILADLTAYPVYVRFQDDGVSVEDREALIALGTDQVFTEELVESVSQADVRNLSPSKAGFVLTKERGAPNIVFGLRDGKLAILGMNY